MLYRASLTCAAKYRCPRTSRCDSVMRKASARLRWDDVVETRCSASTAAMTVLALLYSFRSNAIVAVSEYRTTEMRAWPGPTGNWLTKPLMRVCTAVQPSAVTPELSSSANTTSNVTAQHHRTDEHIMRRRLHGSCLDNRCKTVHVKFYTRHDRRNDSSYRFIDIATRIRSWRLLCKIKLKRTILLYGIIIRSLAIPP